MEGQEFCANTLMDLLQLLNKRNADTVSNSSLKGFYERENLLPLLDYVNGNRNTIFESSAEEQKSYLNFLLVSCLKELYCYLNEYDKAFAVNRSGTNLFMDKISNGSIQIERIFIPHIINEAISRIRVNGYLDDQMVAVIKSLYPDFLEDIRIIPPDYYCKLPDGTEYSLGFNEEDLITVLIEFIRLISDSSESNMVGSYVFYILYLIGEYFDAFTDSDNISIQNNKIFNWVSSLKESCKNASAFSVNVIDYYSCLFDKASEYIETEILNPSDVEAIKNSFLSLIDNVKIEVYNEHINHIERFVDSFFNYRYKVEEEEHILFVKTLVEIIDKSSTPKYKKEFLEQYLLDSQYIGDLFKLQAFKLITKYYMSNKDNGNLHRYYFEIAFSLNDCKYKQEAKAIYETILANGSESSGVYNNLAVIYEYEDKNYNKAIDFYKKALALSPNDKIATGNFERIKKVIKELEERPKKLKDLYFKKTQTWHKKILFTIYKLSEQEQISIDDLCEVTKQGRDTLEKNLQYLQKLGMVEISDQNISLEPTIEQLVKDYIDPKLERQIVKVDNSKLFRPIFYHESEIFLYRALLELFPHHMVFPNLSLKTIFEIEKLKELLDSDTMKYLYMAHVDFAIINTSTYFPILAFEKDSDYNDTDYAKDLVSKKNSIFRAGGIPLIRLRFNSGIEYEKLKSEVREATKSLLLELKESNSEVAVDLTKEFDVRKFGIVNSPIDLETVNTEWVNVVGKAIAQKSRVLDIENKIMQVEISSELKPIIEMSEDTIKKKLTQKFDFLKNIEFIWY